MEKVWSIPVPNQLTFTNKDNSLFITQSGDISANVENLAELCDDFDDIPCSQMDQWMEKSSNVTQYSDISDAEDFDLNTSVGKGIPSFE